MTPMPETNYSQMTKAELIDELQRLRQQVAELEARDPHVAPRALFNSIADPVLVFDEKTKHFLDCNRAAIERYGYTLDEL